MDLEQLGTVQLSPCRSKTGPLKTPQPIFHVPKRQKTILRKTLPNAVPPKPALHFPSFPRKRKMTTPSSLQIIPSQKGTSAREGLSKPKRDDAVAGYRHQDDRGGGRRSSRTPVQGQDPEKSFPGDSQGLFLGGTAANNGLVMTPPSLADIFREVAPIVKKEEALRPLLFKIPTKSPDVSVSEFEKWSWEDSAKKPLLVNTIPTM